MEVTTNYYSNGWGLFTKSIGVGVVLFAIYYFFYKRRRPTTVIDGFSFTTSNFRDFLNTLYLHIKNKQYQENDDFIIAISLQEQNNYHISIQNPKSQTTSEVNETWKHFQNLFPNKRFSRLINDDPNLLSSPLTRLILRKILLFSSNIQVEDIADELSLSSSASISDLSDIEIDEIYERLLPSSNLAEIILSPSPLVPLFDKAKLSGKGEIGKMETVYVQLHHWFCVVKNINYFEGEPISFIPNHHHDDDGDDHNININNHHILDISDRGDNGDDGGGDDDNNNNRGEKFDNDYVNGMICDSEFLSSRMADREPAIGTLIRLSKGYYKYTKRWIQWGAGVYFLEHINYKKTPIFVCRGTRMNPSASSNLLSGINDLMMSMGSLGIRKSWSDISSFLNHEYKTKNFAPKPPSSSPSSSLSFHVVGKSLGGAHAQYLTLLLLQHSFEVRSLSTICSVGIPRYYNSLFLNSLHRPIFVLHVRNGGDVVGNTYDMVPHIGGVLFGFNDSHNNGEENHHNHNLRVEMYYLTVGNSKHLHHDHSGRSLPHLVSTLFQSLGSSHLRQNTLVTHVATPVTSHSLNDELRKGEHLESARWFVALIFNFVTFGFFHGQIPVK